MMATDDGEGLPTSRRYWAAAAIWLALAMTVLDSAIANVALPTIAHDFGADPDASIWIVNAYQIAIVMLLLPAASLGQIWGYRRLYAIGLAMFVVSSIACAAAGGLVALAAARFVQGFGAAAIMAINGALVRFTYPERMLGRGLGLNALVVALASAAGPTVAAIVLSIGSWRWLFAINVPLGIGALAIGLAALPTPPRVKSCFDWRLALLSAATFASFLVAAETAAHGGVAWPPALAAIAGIAAAAATWRLARRRPQPLVPIDLFAIPVLRLSYATSIASFAAQMIGLVALPFYLERRWGFGHAQAGYVITALPVGIAIAAPIAGRLVERRSAALLGGIGLTVLACGYGLTAIVAPSWGLWPLLAALATTGAGFGFFQSPNNRTMIGRAPASRSGAAAGMLAVSRLTGQTLGAIVVALIFRATGVRSVAPFVVAAALGLVAAALSLGRFRDAPERGS